MFNNNTTYSKFQINSSQWLFVLAKQMIICFAVYNNLINLSTVLLFDIFLILFIKVVNNKILKLIKWLINILILD